VARLADNGLRQQGPCCLWLFRSAEGHPAVFAIHCVTPVIHHVAGPATCARIGSAIERAKMVAVEERYHKIMRVVFAQFQNSFELICLR
jgi:hypothetical protein